ncbi:MAG: proline--tRNA ligase [Candidatus Anstonellales archaeon]
MEFSEWYTNILKDAELVDLRYNVKGFLVVLPWAMKTIKLIYDAYEGELEKDGQMPTQFPILIPESNLKVEEEHVKGFEGEVFWVSKAGFNQLEERLALRPTSETAIYPLFALWIQGRKDLPVKIYQSGTVWRYETKATRPFIRVREIMWIETHDAYPTPEEAMEQVKKDVEIGRKVLWEKLGIPFAVFQRPQWDKFAGADRTYAADTIMPDGKVLQIASTHFLGQNFSKVFNIRYMDEDGKEKFVWQTCYGPGISRIYAALISVHGDEKGLVLPFNFAPTQVVIVPIYKSDNKKKIDEYAKKVVSSLEGLRVHYDTSDKTPGFKYNYWEMKGVPMRIEIGEREVESGKIVLVRRDTREKQTIDLRNLKAAVEKTAEKMFSDMKNKAKNRFDSLMHEAETMKEIEKKLELGGFVKVPFCSIEMDGKGCYEKIKESMHAEVRGVKFPNQEKPKNKKCVVCGKTAKHFVYVARQY